MDCFDVPGNEPSRIQAIPVLRRISVRWNWERAKAAEVAAGKRMLELLGVIGESRGNKALRVTGSPIGSGMTVEEESGMTPSSPSFLCSDTGIHKKGSPKNDSESGKSMVEMLGVLALIGLLAILGAKGYDIAMERVNATNIINEVNRRSVIHSQQLLAGSALILPNFR